MMNKLALRIATGAAAVAAAVILSTLATTSSADAPKGPASKPATASAPAPTDQQFLAVMQARCVRCHKQCSSVDELKRTGWVRPGQPDRSSVYTVIGKTRKAGAKYHDVTDNEKTLIRDYIVAIGAPASKPATAPGSKPASRPASAPAK